MFRGLSIRTKLTLYAMASAAVGVLAAVAMIVLSLAQQRDAVSDYLRARLAQITPAVQSQRLQPDQLQSTLRLVAADPALRQVALIDARRKSYVAVPSELQVMGPYAAGYDSNTLGWAADLSTGEQLVVWYDEEYLYSTVRQATLRVSVGLLAAVVTAILFASLAGRWVARPIAELAALARNIPETGDFRVETVTVSRDEVGQLGAAFGEMLSKVERRERALDEARQAAEIAAAEARQLAAQAQATADALAGATDARQRTQRQLEQAQKMEALGRLAGGVAHDFNNLLFVIGTYGDDLARRLEGEDLEAIEQVQEAVRRATKLTQQLLSFSRQPRGESVDVDVGQTLTRMHRLLQRLIGEDIALTVEGTRTRMVVRAPEGALESAIMNLVVNARDALPNGGHVKVAMQLAEAPETIPNVSGSGADRWMRLVVEDDGLGMDDDTRHRAFEPFFTTKPTGEGTGLGLTLVYALCQQLGGQVSIESEPGGGARFELLLPMTEGESGFSVDLPAMTPLPSEEGRVLVAEDDPQVRRLVVKVLAKAGFDVEAVEDGTAALDRLETGPRVDLVVSDVVMPKMGGLDLAQALRRARIEVPVLFISGYPAHPGQSVPFPPELPMLRKPFTAQALRRMVRRMLGRNPVTPPPTTTEEV